MGIRNAVKLSSEFRDALSRTLACHAGGLYWLRGSHVKNIAEDLENARPLVCIIYTKPYNTSYVIMNLYTCTPTTNVSGVDPVSEVKKDHNEVSTLF